MNTEEALAELERVAALELGECLSKLSAANEKIEELTSLLNECAYNLGPYRNEAYIGNDGIRRKEPFMLRIPALVSVLARDAKKFLDTQKGIEHIMGVTATEPALSFTLNEDVIPQEMLKKTFVIEYSPNCAMHFQVRLVGLHRSHIDGLPLRETKDAIGYGMHASIAFDEACKAYEQQKVIYETEKAQ
jgi:hypothetical protein